MKIQDGTALGEWKGNLASPVSANEIHKIGTLVDRFRGQAGGQIAQRVIQHANDATILESADFTSRLPSNFEAFRHAIREARNGSAASLMGLRNALARFAESDALDATSQKSRDGYYILCEEISKMIASTTFDQNDLTTLNLSLAVLVGDRLEDIRTGKSSAKAELDHINWLATNSDSRAELLGLTPEEYTRLDPRDAKIIESTLSIYLRHFWAELERLQARQNHH